ncbi:uncharacterized protein LOC142980773 [Anticarsia gemmatalis]|uniref:uncharacterized protein LOC142980773 n=1 Tax=Anticarsia gemmatalis TaxID=129554 RepID=UPI003F75EB1F
MKNTLKEKFKNNVLVKPLYKLKNRNKIKPKLLISVDSSFNLDGHGVTVKRGIVNHCGDVLKPRNISKRLFLSDNCEGYNKVHDVLHWKNPVNVEPRLRGRKMIGENNVNGMDVEERANKLIQADHKVVIKQVACEWLRFYPLPKLPEESVYSVLIRCILCQLGLTTFLVMWTITWIFVIHSFEGPYETTVTRDFERHQSQLVIELATELRQITPVSPRWKGAIEQRLEEVRQSTLAAVSQGARLRAGQYWQMSGTFLFTVYVMTALGFGAPVPQTVAGRTSALVYAILAVPTHFYLMMNISTFLVVHIEAYTKQLKRRFREKKSLFGKNTLENESPNCNRNSELLKNRRGVSDKIMRLLGMLGACHGVPIVGLLYYIFGACVFGVLRGLGAQDTLMFPIQFTTSGALAHIAGHVRILYGLYIEVAMTLLACALAILRRQRVPGADRFSDKYRLFDSADCI